MDRHDPSGDTLSPEFGARLRAFIEANLEEPVLIDTPVCYSCSSIAIPRSLADVVAQIDETFSLSVLRLIDERGLTDPEVYKRVGLDRKLFSKMRGNVDYQPSKATAILIAIALELSLDETLDLLGRAGYTLSHASKADLVVEFFIDQRRYDVMQINAALYSLDLPLLGR